MTKTPAQQFAAVYYSNRDIRLEKRPIPSILPDEILIRITASGICGSDVMQWYRLPKAPLVLGHEIAAQVIRTGSRVRSVKAGDRVVVSHHVPCMKCRFCRRGHHTVCNTLRSTHLDPGGFCEFARVSALHMRHGIFPIPKNVPDEEASMTEPLGCAIRAQRLVRPGTRSVLVIGCGPAGLLHIALARAWRRAPVFATDIQEPRLKAAQSTGAHYIWAPDSSLREKIKKANHGALCDLVVLCTAAPTAMALAARCVERGGTLLFFAPPEAGREYPLPLFELWRDNVTLISSYAAAPQDMRDALALIASRKVRLKPLISHQLPLAQAAEGFRLVAQAKDCLKVILKP